MKAVAAPSISASKTRSFTPSGVKAPSLFPILSTLPLFAESASETNFPFGTFTAGGGADTSGGAVGSDEATGPADDGGATNDAGSCLRTWSCGPQATARTRIGKREAVPSAERLTDT